MVKERSMKYFKSLWFSIKKSTGLPPNQVFIPISDIQPETTTEVIKKPRKIKEVKIVVKR